MTVAQWLTPPALRAPVRRTFVDVPRHVEAAARLLAQWNGGGQSWHCDVASYSDRPSGADERGRSDLMGVFTLGRRTEGAARAVGAARTTAPQMRRWNRAAGFGVVPQARAMRDPILALSFARLERHMADWLLLYATGDVALWPNVDRRGRALRDDRGWAEAVTDAGHQILWARAVHPAEVRAKQLEIRKADYLDLCRRARVILVGWLDHSADEFLRAYREPLAP